MEGSEYNRLSKLLHRWALGSVIVSSVSFDIEKSLFSSKGKALSVSEGKHVFVSGLARSGTTAILSYLHESCQFASLTYADIPFVLAPNLWKHISGGSSVSPLKKRAHNDGILVNEESPEAFDEVFWKVFLVNGYILKDKLLINEISSETIELFGEYIALVIKKNSDKSSKRYLSKNNNNILRLPYLLQKFPDASFIIPFRNPLQHALSLQNQHQHFCTIHKKDHFALNYMNWIGHHEFGLNQKPFFLGNEELFNEMMQYEKEDINFWLLTWLNYFSYLLTIVSDSESAAYGKRSILLIQYEELCKFPNEVLRKLSEIIELEGYSFNLTPFELKNRKCAEVNPQIVERCNAIYEDLKNNYSKINLTN